MFVAGLLLGMVFYHFFGVKRAKVARLVALLAKCCDERLKECTDYNKQCEEFEAEIGKIQRSIELDTKRFENQVRVIDNLRDTVIEVKRELSECYRYIETEANNIYHLMGNDDPGSSIMAAIKRMKAYANRS